MTRIPDNPGRLGPRGDDMADASFEHAVYDELSRRSPSPDLTSSVMGRLGYMKVSREVARRRMTRRWSGRLAMCALAACAVAVGLHVHELGPDARRPVGPTIPAAIGNDVDYHQQRIKGTIRTIRNLVPEPPSGVFPRRDLEKIDDDVDQSAVGPVRWL